MHKKAAVGGNSKCMKNHAFRMSEEGKGIHSLLSDDEEVEYVQGRWCRVC